METERPSQNHRSVAAVVLAHAHPRVENTRTQAAGFGRRRRDGAPEHAGHRPARHRTRLRAGPVPLGRRADVCPVALVPATAHPLGDPRRHPRGIPSPGLRHHLPPPLDQPVTLLGVHLPGFRGRIDRMLGRSPGECRKGQHAPTWRKAADDQLAAYTDVPADQKPRRSSRSPCALRVLSRRVRRMTPKRRTRRGEWVPSPEQ